MVAQREHMQVSTPAHDDPTRTPSSYAIGPIDPKQIITYQALLSTGQEITLLAPKRLPFSVLTDQALKAGVEAGYLACDLLGLTVPQMVNQMFYTLDYAALEAADEDAEPCSCGRRNASKEKQKKGGSHERTQSL
jgi:hypothetical protein